MSLNRKLARAAGVVCVIVGISITFTLACKEKDVPVVSDSEQLISYLTHSPDAVSMFRKDGLVMAGSYALRPGGESYTDSIISTKRDYKVWVSDTAWNFSSVYDKVAEVRVIDEIVVQTTARINNKDTVTSQTRSFERVAFFRKQGNDADDYLGWTLWGIGGGLTTGAAVSFTAGTKNYRLDTMYKQDNVSYSGEEYMLLTSGAMGPGMASLLPGERLKMTVSIIPKLFPILTYPTGSGYLSTPIPDDSTGSFYIDIQLPSPYSPEREVVLLQFVDSVLGKVKADPIFLPFKTYR